MDKKVPKVAKTAKELLEVSRDRKRSNESSTGSDAPKPRASQDTGYNPRVRQDNMSSNSSSGYYYSSSDYGNISSSVDETGRSSLSQQSNAGPDAKRGSRDVPNGSLNATYRAHKQGANAVGRCLHKMKRGWQRRSPRERQSCLFFACELILLLAFFLQMWSLRTALLEALGEQTAREILLLDLTYDLKVMEMETTSKTHAKNHAFTEFLAKGMHASDVNSILSDEVRCRKIEFASLLYPNGSIAASANINRNGEIFDPSGVVSQMLADPSAGQIETTKFISYNQLKKEHAPLIRERLNDLQMTDFTHLYDTKTIGMIRYVLTPIYSHTNTFLGILFLGDLVNGKTIIPYNVVYGTGHGFAGIYHLDSTRGSYIRAASSAYVTTSFGYKGISAELDIAPRGLLEKAEASGGVVVLERSNGAVFAAKKIDNGKQDGETLGNDVTNGVLVRARFDDEHSLFIEVLKKDGLYVGLIIFVNLVALWLSLTNFIIPLEKLAGKLKAGVKVDLKEIDKMNMGKKYVIRLVITTLASIVLMVLMLRATDKALEDSIEDLSGTSAAVADIVYGMKMDQALYSSNSTSSTPAIRRFLHKNGSSYYNTTLTALISEVTQRKLEFALLVNSSLQIICDANSVSRVGDFFNPEGIVNLTMTNNVAYLTSKLLSYEDFLAASPPEWQEKLRDTTPDSALSPYITHSWSLIRYTTTPVYSIDNDERSKPDGVMVSGDIINGKTVALERMLKIMGHGYAAVYTYVDGTFQLAASIFQRTPDSPIEVDIKVSNKVLRKARESLRSSHAFSTWAEVYGEGFFLSALRTLSDREVTEDGYIFLDDSSNVDTFIVFGFPRSITEHIVNEQHFWFWCCALVQLLSTVYMNYMAYQPLRKLKKVLAKRGFLAGSRQGKSFQERIRDIKRKGFLPVLRELCVDIATECRLTCISMGDSMRKSFRQCCNRKKVHSTDDKRGSTDSTEAPGSPKIKILQALNTVLDEQPLARKASDSTSSLSSSMTLPKDALVMEKAANSNNPLVASLSDTKKMQPPRTSDPGAEATEKSEVYSLL